MARNDFNPRTPCGVRLSIPARRAIMAGFQSTHPLRGATRPDYRQSAFSPDFNPRTPCGVRPLEDWRQAASWSISIHAPLAGCDPNLVVVGQRLAISIHAPLAGCDAQHVQAECVFTISIHAPLAGCDGWTRCRSAVLFTLFQSTHPLRGATLCGGLCRRQLLKFQSTHPLRGATALKKCMARSPEISIHAPLAGCDFAVLLMAVCAIEFQSTHPLRGATWCTTRKTA